MSESLYSANGHIKFDDRNENIISNCSILQAYSKRVYMMNKHIWNVNDLSTNAFNLTESQPGTYTWSSPTSQFPIDGLVDECAVASLIPAKLNFSNQLIMNITTFDGYINQLQNTTFGILFNSLRINVISSNGNNLILRIHPNNLNLIATNMNLCNYTNAQINQELSKWTADSTLSMTDIIVDASTNLFAGRVDLSYCLVDTLQNVSNTATVSFYICNYASMRIKKINNNNNTILSSPEPVNIQVVYENSYSDRDIDYLCSFKGLPKIYATKLSYGDIEFPQLTIPNFTIDGVTNNNSSNLLTFDSIVDYNNIIHTTPVVISHIGWKKSVVLNYLLNPNITGDYLFNFRVPANLHSISGNSIVITSNPININVYSSSSQNTHNCNEIKCNSLLVSGLSTLNNILISNCSCSGNIECSNLTVDNLVTTNSLSTSSLNVNGSITTQQNINANNGTFSNQIECANLNANFVQSNGANVNGDMNLTGNLTIGGTFQLANLSVNNISTSYLDIVDDTEIGGELSVDGIVNFNNGLNVNGTITGTTLSLGADLNVTGTTIVSDLTADVIDINTNLNLSGSFNAVNNNFIIDPTDGFICNLQTTIGSGTSDVVLVVNGSIQTYGNLNINDTDLNLENGALNLGVTANLTNGLNVNNGANIDNLVVNNLSAQNFKFIEYPTLISNSYNAYVNGSGLILSITTANATANIVIGSSTSQNINSNSTALFLRSGNDGSGNIYTFIGYA